MKFSSLHLELSTVGWPKQFQKTWWIIPRTTGRKFRGEIVAPWSKVPNAEPSTVVSLNIIITSVRTSCILSHHSRKFRMRNFWSLCVWTNFRSLYNQMWVYRQYWYFPLELSITVTRQVFWNCSSQHCWKFQFGTFDGGTNKCTYNNIGNNGIQLHHSRKFWIGTFDRCATISPQNFWPVVRAITHQIFGTVLVVQWSKVLIRNFWPWCDYYSSKLSTQWCMG